MKILAIGCAHGDLEKIVKMPSSGVDLILLAGDLGKADLMRKMAFESIERERKGLPEKKYSPRQEKQALMQAYNSTLKIINYLSKIAPVVAVYGNVEDTRRQTNAHSKRIGLKIPVLDDALKEYGVLRFKDNKTTINGVLFGGINYFVDECWVKEFKPSQYQTKLKKAEKKTASVKKALAKFGKVDVLLCHQPPYGILDKVTMKTAPLGWQGKHAGSKAILNYVKKHQPKYVFCAHIHEGEGVKKIGRSTVYNLGHCGYKVIEI
jgi:Icc-related predicted phosphoesterase